MLALKRNKKKNRYYLKRKMKSQRRNRRRTRRLCRRTSETWIGEKEANRTRRKMMRLEKRKKYNRSRLKNHRIQDIWMGQATCRKYALLLIRTIASIWHYMMILWIIWTYCQLPRFKRMSITRYLESKLLTIFSRYTEVMISGEYPNHKPKKMSSALRYT